MTTPAYVRKQSSLYTVRFRGEEVSTWTDGDKAARIAATLTVRAKLAGRLA